MTNEELIEMANDGIQLALQHEGLSICTNPGHTHVNSPCEDDCLDHLHQCSRGCGEWPCAVVRQADLVASHLIQLEALSGALLEGMHALNMAAGGLSTLLENINHE